MRSRNARTRVASAKNPTEGEVGGVQRAGLHDPLCTLAKRHAGRQKKAMRASTHRPCGSARHRTRQWSSARGIQFRRTDPPTSNCSRRAGYHRWPAQTAWHTGSRVNTRTRGRRSIDSVTSVSLQASRNSRIPRPQQAPRARLRQARGNLHFAGTHGYHRPRLSR
jgi:hypothetical protein